ncbi:hypothetical protein BASA81_001323 [Batrachochytrium salamandrivorans]|nr:hypothetical protein BASA81_001323 [Batrachochytrium salamandrivorans]
MEFDDPDEAAHFGDVVLSLAEYCMDAEREIYRKERALGLLPPSDFKLLHPQLQPRLDQQRLAAKVNQEFFNLVIDPFHQNLHSRFQQLSPFNEQQQQQQQRVYSSPASMAKARSTLHQISREWSSQGRAEREQCFGRITQKLQELLPEGAQVAVPGCGLGRLCVDIASLGFRVEGSEFSYQMLLCGDCIMNRLPAERQVYPWIDQASNLPNSNNVYVPVRFPDMEITPQILSRVHIVAGEFTRIYLGDASAKHKFDCVLFCYFLDTCSNLCDYLRVLQHMVKPGGVVISFGPLQWHFQPSHGGLGGEDEDLRFSQSVELTFAEVQHLFTEFGFRTEFHESVYSCGYARNPDSMFQVNYQCEFFVARRV